MSLDQAHDFFVRSLELTEVLQARLQNQLRCGILPRQMTSCIGHLYAPAGSTRVPARQAPSNRRRY